MIRGQGQLRAENEEIQSLLEEPNPGAVGAEAEKSQKRRTGLVGLLLGLVAACAFLPSLEGSWLIDDTHLITSNRLVHSFAEAARWFQGDLFDVPMAAGLKDERLLYYRPLVTLSYALDWAWGSGSPLAFHVTNMLLHGGCAAAAFFAAKRWLKSESKAVFVALLFALHPTKVETVAWISGRPDSMVALFLLLSAAQMAKAQAPRRTWGALFWGACALLSKEIAVVLPLFWMHEIWRRRGVPTFDRSLFFQLLKASAPAWILVGCYLLLRRFVLQLTLSTQHLSPLAYVLSLLETIGRFVCLLVAPHNLSFFWGSLQVRNGVPVAEPLYVALGALTVAAAVGFIAFCLLRPNKARTSSLILLGLGFFVLFPSLRVIPLSLPTFTQGRYLYLALLPILAALLGALPLRGPIVRSLLGTLCAGLFAFCWSRSSIFLNSVTFWDNELRANPDVPRVLREQLGQDRLRGGSSLVARRAVCAFAMAEKNFGGARAEDLLSSGLRAALGPLSDGDPELLQAAKFLEDIRSGKEATYSGIVQLHLQPSSKAARAIVAKPSTWLIFEAELRARAGQVDRAETLLYRAVDSCPECENVRRSAAAHLTLLGHLQSGLDMVSMLPQEEAEALRALADLREQALRSPGLAGAMFWAHVGKAVQDPYLGYRAVVPFAEAILVQGNEQLRSSLALISLEGGAPELAGRAFRSLSREEQNKLLALGFVEETIPEGEPFVPGTCATKAELNP